MHLEGAAADFGRFGVPLDLHLGVLGWPWACILGGWGCPWAPCKRPLGPFSGASFLTILAPKGCPEGSQYGAKIVEKSIQKPVEFSFEFLSGFWSMFGQFWMCFWDSGPSKMSVWCTRGAIFQKFTFFMPDSVFDWFFNDFGRLWEAFWEPKWCQNSFKNQSEKCWSF